MRPARNKLPRPLVLGGLLIGASVLLAVFPSVFAPYDPIAMDYNALLHVPQNTSQTHAGDLFDAIPFPGALWQMTTGDTA